MDYQFENLGPERFQEFCQALLAHDYPNVQCFPVGQADGGRDAIRYLRTSDGADKFIIYQVKYSRRPQAQSDPHNWLLRTVKEEIGKVKKLVPRGAVEYVLLTNVSGTSRLISGSMDKLADELSSQLSIPAQCWWREDLNRRLDSAWDLKWTYLDLMSGTDVMRYLLDSGLTEDRDRRMSTLKTFIKGQYDRDKEVRFKQVDIQNGLIDLFIDVPIAVPPFSPSGEADSNRLTYYASVVARNVALQSRAAELTTQRFVPQILGEDELLLADDTYLHVGAAAFFLDTKVQSGMPQVVLEGAPGQGKSTLAQFICQAHRMQILKPREAEIITESYKPKSVRLPFKIDLRDVATWLSRRDPFATNDEEVAPDGWHKSLEAFLAALVRYHSGGRAFSVDDLYAVAKASSLLIVLDGFDEVAEVSKRLDIVNVVTEGIERLRATNRSIQVIVTSRPAAFVNSPGFPESTFPHLQLTSITREQIQEYAGKWCSVRQLDERETTEVKRTLKERLDQPHIRELARNPMQLAILLTLIRSMGVSLPDKRTALYDSYVERFFNREAEKSQIVQKHRDLLLDIHGYLAWTLQAESEQGQDRGSISSERLKRLLNRYMTVEGRDPSLVDYLFTGMIERVVALVSRVEGTYEFEVQPLREYFAARYLYNTAPYSPAGNPRQGTKTERFAAMAKDFYWLNVARFYAGCYSKGELPSLVDGLKELADTEGFSDINHPRALAAMLLSDWVFTQHQRSLNEAVGIIVNEPGLRYLLTTQADARRTGTGLVIPAACGRDEIVSAVISELHRSRHRDRAQALVHLLRDNVPGEELVNIWSQETAKSLGKERTRWFHYGLWMGVLSDIPSSGLEPLLADCPDDPSRLQSLFHANRMELCESSESRCRVVVDRILSRAPLAGPLSFRGRYTLSPLAAFASIFNNYRYSMPLRVGRGSTVFDDISMMDLLRGSATDESERETSLVMKDTTQTECITADRVKQVVTLAEREWKHSVNYWFTDLQPWQRIVERSRSIFGERWAHYMFAITAGTVVTNAQIDEKCADLLDKSTSVCARAAYARTMSADIDWWRHQFESVSSELDVMFVALSILTWGGADTLLGTLSLMESSLDQLSPLNWQVLCGALRDQMVGTQLQRRGDGKALLTAKRLPRSISPRGIVAIASRTTSRVADGLYHRHLSTYDGDDLPILGFCQEAALRLLATSRGHWSSHLSVLATTYARGVASPYSLYIQPGDTKRGSINLDAAQTLVRNSEMYPLSAVTLGELACRNASAAAIEPVGIIANKEGWFSGSDTTL